MTHELAAEFTEESKHESFISADAARINCDLAFCV